MQIILFLNYIFCIFAHIARLNRFQQNNNKTCTEINLKILHVFKKNSSFKPLRFCFIDCNCNIFIILNSFYRISLHICSLNFLFVFA